MWMDWLDLVSSGGGTDAYTVDTETRQVTLGSDGIPEFKVFPNKLKEEDGSDAAGNFGLLNFTTSNYNDWDVAEQILNGLSAEDFTTIVGEPEMVFYAEDGTPKTYVINGNPGIKSGDPRLGTPVPDAFNARLGDDIGFFLHTDAVLSGSNADFTIVGIQFGTIVAVNLVLAKKLERTPQHRDGTTAALLTQLELLGQLASDLFADAPGQEETQGAFNDAW